MRLYYWLSNRTKFGSRWWFAVECYLLLYRLMMAPYRGCKVAISFTMDRWREAWMYVYNDYDNFMRKE
jgi:hypothetical protein